MPTINNYKLQIVKFPVALVGIHPFFRIVDPSGEVISELHALATDLDSGQVKAMGTPFSNDILRGYVLTNNAITAAQIASSLGVTANNPLFNPIDTKKNEVGFFSLDENGLDSNLSYETVATDALENLYTKYSYGAKAALYINNNLLNPVEYPFLGGALTPWSATNSDAGANTFAYAMGFSKDFAIAESNFFGYAPGKNVNLIPYADWSNADLELTKDLFHGISKDNNFDYFLEPNDESDGNGYLEHSDINIYIKQYSGNTNDAFTRVLIPASQVTYEDAEGSVTSYVGTEGSNMSSGLSRYMDTTKLDFSGIVQIRNQVTNMVYSLKDAQISLPNGKGGQLHVSIGSVVDMCNEGADGLVRFTKSIIKSELATEEFRNVESILQNQSPIFMGKIISGLLQGKDIKTIIAPIALEIIGSGSFDTFVGQLKKIGVEGNDTVKENDLFKFLDEFKNNHELSFQAVTGALTTVITMAILNGKDSKSADYVRAAANVSIQTIVNKGVTSSGYDLLTQSVLVRPTAGAATSVKLIPSPVGAGVIAGVTVLASSLIAGGNLKNSLRDATVAGGTAYAATAATEAILLAVGQGAAIGGPVGAAVGLVLSTVLSLVEGKLFGTPGERVYHNETIGSYINGDTIIGVRETGALLIAKNGVRNIIGTDGPDVLVGDGNKNNMNANGGDDDLEGRGDDDAMICGAGNDHAEGGDGNDYIDGGDGNDILFGDKGDDIIIGGNGNDIIYGGDGNDSLEGGDGNDAINGGAGDDVIAGGVGDDAINGGAGDDKIRGGVGDDNIEGNIGNDELYGDDGNDVIEGGYGNDTIHGDDGNDIIYGDDGNDILYGDLGDDSIDGGKGADLIYGGLGNDVLFGGDGNDHLYGEIGNDYMVGGSGNDLLNGGEGDDIYSFNKGDGQDIIEDSNGLNDVIRLSNYTIDEVSFVKNGDDLILRTVNQDDAITINKQLTTSVIEYLVFSDGKTVDLASLRFDSHNVATYNVVASNTIPINETLFAGTWQEVDASSSFKAYNKNSSWYQNNYDTSVINTEAALQLYNDVQVKATIVKDKHWYGRTTTKVYYNDYFESNLTIHDSRVITAQPQGPVVGGVNNDRIVGASWAETIRGGTGDDQLYGNGGDDIIYGEVGNDIIFGGSGNDTVYGGDDNDKIYGDMGNDILNGENGNDTIFGAWGNDTIHGGNGDDYISGGDDDDTIYGDSVNDSIYGDAGNDTLQGGDGSDYINGGIGNDTISGGAGDDYLSGGAGNDYLDGGDGDDIIRGDDGTDTLIGGAGNDTLVGGRGMDIIDGGAGSDMVSYAESNSGVIINLATSIASGGYADGDRISNVENVTGSDFDDIITGDSNDNILIGGYGNDQLYAGAGNDTIYGGAGADTIDGGDGFDTVSYADSCSGVEIDLVRRRGRFGYAEGDIITNVEHIIGSAFNDTFIIGNIGSNLGMTFDAGEGIDTAVLAGRFADYNVTLDGTSYLVNRKSDNFNYTLPQVEKLAFSDRTISYADFPSNGDSTAIVLQNLSSKGIIAQASSSIQTTIKSAPSKGTVSVSISNNNQIYTYVPTVGKLGADSFKIQIVNQNTNLTRLEKVNVNIAVDEFANGVTSVLVPDIQRTNKTQVNTFTNSDQYSPRTTVLLNGNYVVTWASNTQDGGLADNNNQTGSVYAQMFDNAGVKIGNEFRVNTAIDYNQNTQTVTQLDNGGFAIAWNSYISYTPPPTGGIRFGNVWVVPPRTYPASWVYQNSVQIFDANGVKVGAEQRIDSTNMEYHPSIANITNGYVAIWDEINYAANPISQSIYLQKFSNAGSKIGTKISVATHLGGGNFGNPNVTQLKNGNLAIVYNSNYNAMFGEFTLKIVDINGTQVISNSNINYTINLSMPSPKVILQDNGNIILSWQGYRNGASTSDNYVSVFQIFSQNGTALSEQKFIKIPDWSNLNNIISLSDNHFLVSYLTSDDGSATNKKIAGQLFDATGNKIGNEFIIHDQGNVNNSYGGVISLSKLANGNVLLSWGDSAQDGSGVGIFSKIINIDYHTKTGDTYAGTSGNDVLKTASGVNTILSDAGADIIDGGANADTVSYANSPAGVNINLTALTSFAGRLFAIGAGGYAEGDRLINIENIIGSTYDDSLTGDANDNILAAGGGNNIINGMDGDDVLTAADGNNFVTGGRGNDMITTGSGFNIAAFSGISSGYSIVMDNQIITIQDTNVADGDDGIDVLTGIDQLNFTNQNFTLDDFPSLTNGTANVVKNIAAIGMLGNAPNQVFTLKNTPTHGTVSFDNNGLYLYKPSANYIGIDSFSYIAKNSNGFSKIINIDINVSEANTGTQIGTAGPDSFTGSNGRYVGFAGYNSYNISGNGNSSVVATLSPNGKDVIYGFGPHNKLDLSDFNGLVFKSYDDLKSCTIQHANDTVLYINATGQSITLQNFHNLTKFSIIGSANNTAPAISNATNCSLSFTGDTGSNFMINVGRCFIDSDNDPLEISIKNVNASSSALPAWIQINPLSGWINGTVQQGISYMIATAQDPYNAFAELMFNITGISRIPISSSTGLPSHGNSATGTSLSLNLPSGTGVSHGSSSTGSNNAQSVTASSVHHSNASASYSASSTGGTNLDLSSTGSASGYFTASGTVSGVTHSATGSSHPILVSVSSTTGSSTGTSVGNGVGSATGVGTGYGGHAHTSGSQSEYYADVNNIHLAGIIVGGLMFAYAELDGF